MYMAQASLHWTKDQRFLSDFTKINLLFWGFIALINYFQDAVLLTLEGNSSPWSFSAIFSSDWPLWAALTPFIIRLAVRYPMTWKGMYSSFSIQFGLATLFVIVHTILEFLIIELLVYTIFPQHASTVYLPGYFMASIHSRYIVYFLLVGGIQRFELYSKYRRAEVEAAQLKEQLTSSQLEALRMQLQPHFLFNTHNTIVSLLLRKENEKGMKMLMVLSDLLRNTLEKSKNELITVSQELEIIKLYMNIQQIRFNDRLKFIIEADRNVYNLRIPSFLLQPLIENAVIHGIEPQLSEGEIRLIIKKVDDESLSIQILNNGVGWSDIHVENQGLSNTRSRLNQLYGSNYTFEISCGENHQGTLVQIQFPFA